MSSNHIPNGSAPAVASTTEAMEDVPMLDRDGVQDGVQCADVHSRSEEPAIVPLREVIDDPRGAYLTFNHDETVGNDAVRPGAISVSRESSVSTDKSLFGAEDEDFDLGSLIIGEESASHLFTNHDTIESSAIIQDRESDAIWPNDDKAEPCSASPHIIADLTDGQNAATSGSRLAIPSEDEKHNEGPLGVPAEQESDEKHYPPIKVIWEKNGFQVMPKWTSEPRIESVIELLKNVVSPLKNYEVKHMWNGTYNKFYSVDFDEKRFVMKLTLPVCSRTKTESEVATLRWNEINTNLSVPRIERYSSDANNPTGCEWILMTRIDGRPLSECWRQITIGSKERIVVQIAEYASAVYNKQFRGIGNIYPPNDGSENPQLGEIASMAFFWHTRPSIDPDRGPFKTSKEWERRRLHLLDTELWERLREMRTWPARQLVWRMLGMSCRLWNLPDILFASRLEPEYPVLDLDPPQANGRECQDQGGAQSISPQCELRQEGIREREKSPGKRSRRKSRYGFLIDSDDDDDEANPEDGLATTAPPIYIATPEKEVEEESYEDSEDVTAIKRPFAHDELKLGAHRNEQVNTTTNPEHNGISDQVRCQGGGRSEEECNGMVLQEEEEEQIGGHRENFKDLGAEADPETRFEPEAEPELERTMLWHDNISADNIMVDENGILMGVVDWDCVSCLPVASSCDWPAFLQDGRHRAVEPEIRDYVDYGRGRLRENYWRAYREFELTFLRLRFAQEMRWRCPGWYRTWQENQTRRDYEAAVQHCDIEFTIGIVETWYDAVEKAVAEGRDPKYPAVMSLAGKLTEGLDWTDWDD